MTAVKETTSLTVIKKEPASLSFEHVRELARSAAASGFFAGVKTPEQALVLMALAQAEGIHPMQAMQRYDVIQGKPAKKAQAMLADFLAAGGRVEWIQHGDQCCEAKFSHPQGGEIVVKWDLEKAKLAQLTGKDSWRKHPENMLHARCVSNGVRFVYPAATGGLYDPTEVADFAEQKFAQLPQETPKPEIVRALPKATEVPPVPDIVESLPGWFCKGSFKPLAGYEGVPFNTMAVEDLEHVVSTVRDNKSCIKTDTGKSWANAIEAAATEALRDAQMDDMLPPPVAQ